MTNVNTLRFSGLCLTELREEASLSRKSLAVRLGLPWEIVSLWESSPAPGSPRACLAYEPTASQLQDLARELDAHPLDFFHSYEDAPALEKDEERAAGRASGIHLDGEKLARMRKLMGLSYPQAATRARVPVAAIQAAESGRTINTGALLRLLQTYEPKEDPLTVMARVIAQSLRGERRGGRPSKAG